MWTNVQTVHVSHCYTECVDCVLVHNIYCGIWKFISKSSNNIVFCKTFVEVFFLQGFLQTPVTRKITKVLYSWPKLLFYLNENMNRLFLHQIYETKGKYVKKYVRGFIHSFIYFTFHWSYTDVELVMYTFSIINKASVHKLCLIVVS